MRRGVPFEAVRENPSRPPGAPGVGGIFGVLWLVDTSPLSASMFTWPSPCVCVCVQVSSFYKDTSHIALQPTLLQCDLIVFTCFQIKPPSEVLGVRTSVYEFGGNTEQPITPSHSLWTPPPGRKRLSSLPSA